MSAQVQCACDWCGEQKALAFDEIATAGWAWPGQTGGELVCPACIALEQKAVTWARQAVRAMRIAQVDPELAARSCLAKGTGGTLCTLERDHDGKHEAHNASELVETWDR